MDTCWCHLFGFFASTTCIYRAHSPFSSHSFNRILCLLIKKKKKTSKFVNSDVYNIEN